MTRIDKESLKGFVPAVVTPFTPGGEIMEAEFEHLVAWLVELGAGAICVAGDNGESWALDVDERARLTRLAVDATDGRAPVLTGVSAPGRDQTIRYAQAAMEAGAAGILCMPQTYVLKATREELLRRFSSLAAAVDAPIVLYNSPRRVGIELGLDDVEAIMSVAPVVGLKESHRDFFHHTHLLHRFGQRIAVMVGPCHYILPGLALGASGFIATGPEFLGQAAGRLTDVARRAPDAEFEDLHFKLTSIYETLMSIGTWPSAFKAGLNLIGQPAGVPRDPVLPLAGADLAKLEATLDGLGLLPA